MESGKTIDAVFGNMPLNKFFEKLGKYPQDILQISLTSDLADGYKSLVSLYSKIYKPLRAIGIDPIFLLNSLVRRYDLSVSRHRIPRVRFDGEDIMTTEMKLRDFYEFVRAEAEKENAGFMLFHLDKSITKRHKTKK